MLTGLLHVERQTALQPQRSENREVGEVLGLGSRAVASSSARVALTHAVACAFASLPKISKAWLTALGIWRVFGVLGPTEAVVTMAAFVAGLVAAGWRPGGDFPTGTGLLAASGAAFTAIVLGQMANAFACRSTTRPVRTMGWRGNPLLLWAVLAELAALILFLGLPSLASLLDQRPPAALGLAVALLAMPAVVAVDTVHKQYRRRHALDE